MGETDFEIKQALISAAFKIIFKEVALFQKITGNKVTVNRYLRNHIFKRFHYT